MSNKQDKYTGRRLRSSYVTSIVSISLVLFSIGLIGLLLLHAKKLSDYVKENISCTVIMKKDVKAADVIYLQKKLDARDYVKSTEYITEEDAAKDFEKELGEDFVGLLGYNPLHSSIKVFLKAEYASPAQFELVKTDLLKNANVQEVVYQENVIHLVNDNVRKIALVILAFSVLFLIIAVALINNTIRLSVYSKRFLIRSMQLVGATEGFIRKPFVKTEVFHGFLSSIIAIGGLIGVIYLARKEIPDIVSMQSADLFAYLFVIVILTGVILTWLSTFFAVRRFLRAKTDSLYIQY